MKATSWRQVTPYRIEVRQGGGGLALFGLPFFAAGVFMFLSLAGVVRMSQSDTSTATRLVLPLMALAFTAVGGTLVFGRVWTAIDRAEGTFERHWGLLVPFHSESARLSDCDVVVVGFSQGDSDSADQFPVMLRSRDHKSRKVLSASSYADARACATAIARLLDINLEDATTDHAVSVPASKGTLSLSERLRLDGREEVIEQRPSNMRSTVESDGAHTRITIPASPAHPALIAITIVPIAIVIALFGPFSQFFRQTKTPDPIGWMFLGFFALLFAVAPGLSVLNAIVRSRWGATIVTASRDGIRIEEHTGWRTKTTGTYAATDIFDLDYSTSESTLASARRTAVAAAREADGLSRTTTLSPGMERALTSIVSLTKSNGITLKTRAGLVKIGAGLSDDEIRYLHALVRRTLAGGR